MGYYTRFEFEFLPADPFTSDHLYEEDLMKGIRAISGYNHFDEAKWYNHEEHLRKFTKGNKTVIIKLTGEGEETGDVWCKYFLDGKMAEYRQPKWSPPKLNLADLS